MRSLVILALCGALIYTTPLVMQASALDSQIDDSFSTNPMTSRWCERWHHVHYFGAPYWHMRAFDSVFPNPGECTIGPGTPDSCCSNAADCEEVLDLTPAYCSSTRPAFFLITPVDYQGVDPRVAKVEFGLYGNLPYDPPDSTGHHVAVYSVTHGNCHGGVQGILIHEGSGVYRLGLAVGLDPLTGFCTGGGVHMGDDALVTAPNTVSLSTSTSTKYRLEASSAITQKPGDTDEIAASVKLFDKASGTQLGTTFSHVFVVDDATWYNGEAKRTAACCPGMTPRRSQRRGRLRPLSRVP